jgi:molybdopterin/thiamine biosynthesis adenylyltransferase
VSNPPVSKRTGIEGAPVAPRNRGSERGHHVVVVGVGNIGSHTVPLLARLPGIGRLTLVDQGLFEESNRENQNVAASSIGRAKVEVMAERVHEIDPAIELVLYANGVEDVPLGRLRCDLVLSAPDSRRARVTVNRVACWLGIPWIDAGVDAGGELARVTTWRPAEQGACCQCIYGPADYAAMAQEYSCAGLTGGGTPSGASAGLGSLAASMQVLSAARLLGGAAQESGVQTVLALNAASISATRIGRNPGCRFEHESWSIEALPAGPAELSIGDALRLGSGSDPVSVAGQRFHHGLTCLGCGSTQRVVQVSRRTRSEPRACSCGGRLEPTGAHTTDSFAPADFADADLHSRLSRLGLLAGDVLTVGDLHFELGRS